MIEFYYFLIYIFTFCFGAILGSFLNVLILRIHKDEQWWSGRSYCPKCKKELSWIELIPILSFLLQKGKCKNCNKKISIQYPIVEMCSALLGVFLIYKFGITPLALLYFIVGYLMLGSFVSDLKFMELPEIFSWSTFILAIIYQIFFAKDDIFLVIYGLIFGFLFFWLQFFFTKGKGLGEGDIRLGLIMGAFLAWPMVIYAISASYILATLILLPLVLLKKVGKKSMIPLGVFLIPVFLFFLYFNQEVQEFFNNYFFFG